MKNYLFDVDGTLTPSRLSIDPEFKSFFKKWIENKNVFLVTGSDKEKTIEQVGKDIWLSVTRVYQSCGNQVWENGKLIKENHFYISDELKNELKKYLNSSKWKERFGNHFEQRVGLVNFSIIGRDCPQNKRQEYYLWDKKHEERKKICQHIMSEFKNIEASIGGEISIDIYEKNKNKAQVLDDLNGDIIFFGDRCEPGGNDFPIVEQIFWLIDEHTIHSVNDWTETHNILKNLY